MAAERLDAFFIREVVKGDGTKESYWNRIGSAFVNRDGSINVKLFLTPASGEIHLRKPKARPPADSNQVAEETSGPSVDFGENT